MRVMHRIAERFSFYGRTSRLQWRRGVAGLVTSVTVHIAGFRFGRNTVPSIEVAGINLLSYVLELYIVGAVIVGCWLGLAMFAKRWHDLGHSGWWTLMLSVPIIGFISLLVLGFQKGIPEEEYQVE